MASNGIRDRVAIVGMGCTPFGEHWDKDTSDLLVDAAKEALASAGVELAQVDAFWLGTLFSSNAPTRSHHSARLVRPVSESIRSGSAVR